jgi:anti-sigma B factor antagonist
MKSSTTWGTNKMSLEYYETIADFHLVTLSGPLNASRAEDVIQLFRDLSERGIRRLVVDLTDVPFIDSRGLAALIVGYRIFGGDTDDFRLAGIQEQPRLAFELTGYDQVFKTFPCGEDEVAEEIDFGLPLQAIPGYRSPAFVSRLAVPDLAA